MDLKLIDGFFWGCELRLPEWAGYQSRHGAYGSIDSPAPSTGRVKLVYAPDGRDTEPLTNAEMELLKWFEKHHARVSHAVFAAILDWCSPNGRQRRQDFGWGDEFPEISDLEQLKSHLGLHTVCVHQFADRKNPYIGFEFGCDWEEEHGLGVLMHGTRCVEIGQADSAFTLWRVIQDAERSS